MYQIFYYWDNIGDSEPPAHIRLCLQSWLRNSGADRIIEVNQENIEVITYGAISRSQVKLFTPAQRSDAAMVATMSLHRGIFLDADTILLPSFDPGRYLNEDMPTMYANKAGASPLPMLSFLASPSQGSSFMKSWLDGTLRNIRHEETSWRRIIRRAYRERIKRKNVHVRWDYLGAAVLNNLANQHANQGTVILLDTVKHGYLPQSDRAYYGPEIVNDYWLSEGSDLSFTSADYPHGIVTLQNSWLPTEITAMNECELLDHPSRLGRLLNLAIS